MATETICLVFGDEVPDAVRPRISYAFRVFAAIYGYAAVEGARAGVTRGIQYGGGLADKQGTGWLQVPTRYRAGARSSEVKGMTSHRYAGEDFPLYYGVDEETGTPDWLGEIFEWLSGNQERETTVRDEIGRIPYRETVFFRQGISPRKPYASLLMAWLQNVLRNGNENKLEALCKAPSPIPGAEHVVICSQDIDFYLVSRWSTLVRLVKNLGISILVSKSWPFFRANVGLLYKLLQGRRVGDFLPALVAATAERDVRSSMFVVARHGHRRDPNYEIRQVVARLSEAVEQGHSVELHGSYRSIAESETLLPEMLMLERAMGSKAQGNRQHWLRFGRHEKLYAAIEECGLVFDSTLGFSETVGFRNGASFAFPPYDFRADAAHGFLEIPLVLMDVSLEAASKTLGDDPQKLADEVLAASRRFGWGGVSVLWHNPMEPLHVPSEINRVFWQCAPLKGENAERWMSGREFFAHCLSRYQDAGLLEGVRAEPPNGLAKK